MTALITAALKDEVQPLLARLNIGAQLHLKPATAYQGILFGQGVTLLVTGMGRERTEAALRSVLALDRPDFILQVGYAGGASSVVSVGQIVLADRVVEGAEGQSIMAEIDLLKQAEEKCGGFGLKIAKGGLVTVDHVVADAAEKARLGLVHGALALDMESFWTARFAAEQKIPCLVAKAILDPVGMSLPPLDDVVNAEGEVAPVKALKHFVQHPKDVMAMPKLQANAHQARDAIAQFVKSWLIL